MSIMSTTRNYVSYSSDDLELCWNLLNEYNDFRRIAQFRLKLIKQLTDANISLINVPRKTLIMQILTRQLFHITQLEELKAVKDVTNYFTQEELAESNKVTETILMMNPELEDSDSLTDTWFELNELKAKIKDAQQYIPATYYQRKQMLNKILGYEPLNEIDNTVIEEEKALDVDAIFPKDDILNNGDLFEFSSNRLHDAFYVFKTIRGTWKQIKSMWLNKLESNYQFHFDKIEDKNEVILVPAMEEYGYGVPYLFATTPWECLPDGAVYKYIDINHFIQLNLLESSTIQYVLKEIEERKLNPHYHDDYMDEDLTVDLNTFPQEYIAVINVEKQQNVIWYKRAVYGTLNSAAKNLNDNREIFLSRRLLEAKIQFDA
ncbi:unnamed protein product [Didymodactylos carnosus]|uniref:Uncharacterized protein n=1 Tax=Didymodactylos carnosus TaxID=1234261 RepID=A0A814VHI5_9BILA|nr:unnamed protein product [Didymodactylos carnosus]CAF1188283.1 unnamed protein product [Didymodactylos carnosus]CAF3706339.1 unnamed protein product [Didymodactylos carnosus]CAF3952553.1 unnamed protein product [Didymodactylos carnosus]